MAELASIGEAAANWVNERTWPPHGAQTKTVLYIAAATGSKFTFVSGFSYFKITGTYEKTTHTLHDIAIGLNAPTNAKSVVAAATHSYPLSKSNGHPVTFNLGDGYVKGKVSFKYSNDDHILVTYSADLPYAGELEDTLDIAPTELSESAGLKPVQLKSSLTVDAYKAQSHVAKSLVVDTNEQALFVKYLKDFVVGPQQVAVVTYYEGVSRAFEITIPIPPVFELVLSIDPLTLSVSATLYAVLPIYGRVKLAEVSGSLITGVEFNFNVYVAKGTLKLWAKKESNGKHSLWASGSGWLIIYGDWSFGPSKIFDLPF